MTVRSKTTRTTLVSIDGANLIRLFGLAIWIFGLSATVWMGHRFFPDTPAGTVLLGAVVLQVVLSLGQLRVVRRYYNGLPTLLFGADALINLLALFDLIIPVDYSSSWAFFGSFTEALQRDTTTALFVGIVCGFVAWKVATTPEGLVHTGGE